MLVMRKVVIKLISYIDMYLFLVFLTFLKDIVKLAKSIYYLMIQKRGKAYYIIRHK